MAFLTDEDREPPWDPFAPIRAEQTESAEPEAGPAPVQSWGTGAIGRPSEAFIDPDATMDRLLRSQWDWMKHGIPPRRTAVAEGIALGFLPPAD